MKNKKSKKGEQRKGRKLKEKREWRREIKLKTCLAHGEEDEAHLPQISHKCKLMNLLLSFS